MRSFVRLFAAFALLACGFGALAQEGGFGLLNGANVRLTGPLTTGNVPTATSPSSISDGGVVPMLYGSSTFAGLPPASTAGRLYNITDAGVNGSLWRDTATVWKPVAGFNLMKSFDATGANRTTEVIDFQYQFPAGFLIAGDRLYLIGTYIKSGVTDPCQNSIRLGKLGTTSDVQAFGFTILTTTQRQVSRLDVIRIESSTTLSILNSTAGFWTTSTNAYPGDGSKALTGGSTTADALYYSAAVVRGSGTSDTCALVNAELYLVRKAN